MDSQTRAPDNDTLQRLWADLEAETDLLALAPRWLALQCARIPGVSLAVLVLETRDGFTPCALYPEEARNSERLADLIERSLEQGSGLWLEQTTAERNGGVPVYALSYPLKLEDEIRGMVAIELPAAGEQVLAEAMQQLRWGMGWLQRAWWRQRARDDEALLARLQPALHLLERINAESRFDAAALTLVNELADRFDCERVSLGVAQDDQIRLQAVSHSARIEQQMNLMRLLGAAMEETLDQRAPVCWPAGADSPRIHRSHDQLAAEAKAGAILSLPLMVGETCFGVLLFERGPGQCFTDTEQANLAFAANLLAPVLEEKQRLDAPLLDRLRQHYRQRRLPDRTRYLLAGLLTLLLALSLIRGDYLLNADAQLEGALQRVIAAPFNGFIDEAPVRAGDRVRAGQLLARLDDRDLRLERIKWLSERASLQKQSQDARARRQRAEVTILESQIAQTQAELQLVENRLARTRLEAPFDGLIVSGDLSQRLGGAVQQGEVLFEIAPLQGYRLILQVEESRIADVEPQQQGQLVLTALPDKSFAFVIEKITPVANAAEGSNRFRVEARLQKSAPQLRPGMKGIAKVFIDRRPLLSIWTRNLREWLALQYWRWLG